MTIDDEIARWSTLPEGQFFERKSAWLGPPSQRRRRDTKAVAKDIAETLAAMANADGGELVVGLEDNGDLTGVPGSEGAVDLLLKAPG